jgi:hypothetical protein
MRKGVRKNKGERMGDKKPEVKLDDLFQLLDAIHEKRKLIKKYYDAETEGPRVEGEHETPKL